MSSTLSYLSTWPTGEDLSGLKPQMTISDAIVKHIKDYDSEFTDGGVMPRVIGLEGKWGSGKSNIIKQLGESNLLKDTYNVIEFDAWAYQEDEYRISLMEHVTDKLSLIEPEKEEDYIELMRKALSREEYENTKFEPHVSGLLFGLIVTIAFTSLFGFILSWFPDNEHYRWCRLFFVVAPWVVLSIYTWFQRKNIEDLLVVYENAIRNGASTKSVYSREPSVSDLRAWLSKTSELCGKKLIVVIDNMDRLPKEKLKKLWSMIHIFANNEGMANTWIIIPYDEQKLKDVIGDDYKQYTRKTIPVTISVGEPIVSDIRDLFDGLYEKAFGKNEENLDYIRALFAVTNEKHSIRDIIYFINSMVAVKRQFEGFSMVSIALYVVMEDEIKEHPYKLLLTDSFASKYAPVVPVTEDNRSEVAAIVYHVPKDNAMQVVYGNVIDHAVMGDDKLPTEDIKDKSDFYKVLTDYCSKVEVQTYEGYIDVLDMVEAGNPTDKYKSEIIICWQYVIQYYLGFDLFQLPWISSERMEKMLAHCDEKQRGEMLNKYAVDLFTNRKTKGEDIYKYAKELDSMIDKFGANRNTVFSTIPLTPSKFMEYLDAARDQYAKYPVVCDSEAWVQFCCNLIENAADKLQNLCYMRSDERYDFRLLLQKAEGLIGENGKDERNSLNAYRIYRSLSEKPVKVRPARCIAVSDIINNFDPIDNDPVFIALRMYHNNLSVLDDELVPQTAEEIMYLMHPLEIFDKCIRGSIESYKKVTKFIIKNKMMCDYRLQTNAMDISLPLVDKGIVTKNELEEYFKACYDDAENRGLQIGAVVAN